jgi:tetratricopeptide (TPR) repeat protein
MDEDESTPLGDPAEGRSAPPEAECPPLTEWTSLAAGLLPAARGNELLAHAIECDGCGASLNDAMEDFSTDFTEDELRMVESLQSSKPEWQRDMAKRMAAASRGRPAYIQTWLAKAAVILLALGGGWLAWNHWFATDPARLIAKAYTQQRPFDYRIPGAAYAELRQERRPIGSAFQAPSALLEAEASVARELERNPDDVKWLELHARADMLGRQPDAAIDTLQHALERKPDDPDLMADLGMAYALRAEAPNHDVDYGYAIEYLGRSLKSKPNSPEVVFNRALVYEQMFLYDEAIREWRHYLELDKAGSWKEEAQRHLADVEQKKKDARRP